MIDRIRRVAATALLTVPLLAASAQANGHCQPTCTPGIPSLAVAVGIAVTVVAAGGVVLAARRR